MLSVDIEAELKAGQVVDPESGIQFCAIAAGATASSVRRAADFFNPPAFRSNLLDGSEIPVDVELSFTIA